MSWDLDIGSGGGRGYIIEGNVSVLVFKREAIKVRFLVKEYDLKAQVKKGMTPEQAKDLLYTHEMWEDWYVPISHWEHVNRDGGKFSTSFCMGTGNCSMCESNQRARMNGITENKLLPYPVRKRYVLPVYVYDMDKVLYVKQNGDFFKEAETYLDKFGYDSDFELSKSGQGLDTSYKVVYAGNGKTKIKVSPMKPKELDFTPIEQRDFKADAEAEERNGAPPVTPPKEKVSTKKAPPAGKGKSTTPPKGKASGSYVVTFGTYNGKTLHEIMSLGDKQFIEFLAERGNGEIQQQAIAFLKENK